MEMILEQASDGSRCEVVEITTLEQVLKIAQTGHLGLRSAGVIITVKSLIDMSHNNPDIKWHITIYDGYIE